MPQASVRTASTYLDLSNRRFSRRVSSAVSATLVAGGMALGMTARADDQPLAEVTVQANSLEADIPLELSKSGTRVDVISGAEVKNTNAVDAATALENLAPGLYLAPKNGPFDYVKASLQGSRTGDILWLVDGVRLNNRLYTGTTPLDTLPASMVDHIEVIEGGQALFYGTQAVAGAVNIVTKGITKSTTGDVSVAADTEHGLHFDGYASDTVGGNGFVFYVSGDKSSGYQPFRDQDLQPSGTDHHRAYDVLTFGTKYAFEFSDDLRLSANWQHTNGQLDYALPFSVAAAHNNRDEDLLTAKLDWTLNQNVQLFIKPYFHDWRSHYTEYDNTVPVSNEVDVIEDNGPWGYKDFGVNVLTKLQFDPRIEYFVGYDMQRYSGSDAVLVISQHTEDTNAVFGQVRTTSALFPNLRLAAGVRYSDPSVGQAATVWNVSGQYDVGGGVFLRGQAGTAFRLPTAEELFANDPQDERGNPNLKPEESRNANLSVGQNQSMGDLKFTWELIGFYRNITNLIDYATFDATTNQDVFGNVPGTVHMRGGELSLDMAAGDAWSGHFDYTHNHSIDPSTSMQISQVPKDLVKAQVDYHPPQLPLGLTATLTHVGTVLQTGMWDGTETFGNYVLFDLSGRYFLDSARHHRLDLSVQNLFDRTYATALGNGVSDADGSSYTYWNLGVPRTFRLAYTYTFR
jgi:outer membrane cobalamin receptor